MFEFLTIFEKKIKNLGAMFPLPRVVYAMANDGLLPRCLGSVHYYFKTPLQATLLAGNFNPILILPF